MIYETELQFCLQYFRLIGSKDTIQYNPFKRSTPHYQIYLISFRFKPAIEELVSKTKVEVLLLENSIKSITKLSESVEQKNTDCLKKVQDTISQYTEALVEYEQELKQKVIISNRFRAIIIMGRSKVA